MQVLAEVDAVGGEMRVEGVEACSELRHLVATVIKYNIKFRYDFFDARKKCGISLVTDVNLKSFSLHCPRGGINVHAVYRRLRAKVCTPQLQRATASYPNLKKVNWLANESMKVAVVYLEVMRPFFKETAPVRSERGDHLG